MTIAFTTTLLSPLPLPEAGLSPAGETAQRGFAALLAGRALLAAPLAARPDAEQGGYQAFWPSTAAPAALRFDEASLFGQAFLSDRGPPAAMSTGQTMFSPPGEAASWHGDRSAVGSPPQGYLGRERRSAALPISARPVEPARAAAFATSPGLEASAVSAQMWSGTPMTSGRPAAAASAPPRVPQNPAGPPIAAARTVRAAQPLSLPSANSGDGTSAGSERARDARSRFVEQLGPVHVVLCQDDGAVHLAARIAGLPAVMEGLLERRLRDAVAGQTRAPASVRINGHPQPTDQGG